MRISDWSSDVCSSDLVAGKGSCDFVRDVAAPFSVMVFMRMMGFPPERFDDFRALADQFFNARDPQQIGTVSQMIIAELMGLIEVKRAAAAAGGDRERGGLGKMGVGSVDAGGGHVITKRTQK